MTEPREADLVLLGRRMNKRVPSANGRRTEAPRAKGKLSRGGSQRGRSDDRMQQTKSARSAGALTVALVNAENSPLARECDIALPLCAGAELSVAATKSFVATLAAVLRIVAELMHNDAIRGAMTRLPDRLAAATHLDWSACFESFAPAASLITIGRGPTLSIAREAALKLKETCNLHAEGYSSAEFQHGPMALVTDQYPILMFTPGDEAAVTLLKLAERLSAKNAALFRVAHSGSGRLLPALAPDQPEADAACMLKSFYVPPRELSKLP